MHIGIVNTRWRRKRYRRMRNPSRDCQLDEPLSFSGNRQRNTFVKLLNVERMECIILYSSGNKITYLLTYVSGKRPMLWPFSHILPPQLMANDHTRDIPSCQANTTIDTHARAHLMTPSEAVLCPVPVVPSSTLVMTLHKAHQCSGQLGGHICKPSWWPSSATQSTHKTLPLYFCGHVL